MIAEFLNKTEACFRDIPIRGTFMYGGIVYMRVALIATRPESVENINAICLTGQDDFLNYFNADDKVIPRDFKLVEI